MLIHSCYITGSSKLRSCMGVPSHFCWISSVPRSARIVKRWGGGGGLSKVFISWVYILTKIVGLEGWGGGFNPLLIWTLVLLTKRSRTTFSFSEINYPNCLIFILGSSFYRSVKQAASCLSPGSSFCMKISTDEYEQQKRDQTAGALVQMMKSTLANVKTTMKEKKQRLQQFRKHHPDLYSKHFDGVRLSLWCSRWLSLTIACRFRNIWNSDSKPVFAGDQRNYVPNSCLFMLIILPNKWCELLNDVTIGLVCSCYSCSQKFTSCGSVQKLTSFGSVQKLTSCGSVQKLTSCRSVQNLTSCGFV